MFFLPMFGGTSVVDDHDFPVGVVSISGSVVGVIGDK